MINNIFKEIHPDFENLSKEDKIDSLSDAILEISEQLDDPISEKLPNYEITVELLRYFINLKKEIEND